MADELEIRAMYADGGIRLLPTGVLDVATAPQFDDAVREVMSDGGPVHIELAGLEFLDSVGIAALMRAAHLARENLQQLTFGRAEGQVETVLGVVRADQFLMFAEDDSVDGHRRV